MMKKDRTCRRCGRCCIVCTDIGLTKEEVGEYLYPKRRRNTSGNPEGWSKWIMMRGLIFEPQLKREIFACVYWDPMTRECLIYEDRPTVCRMYRCPDQGVAKVHRIWLGIKAGKKEALCMDA